MFPILPNAVIDALKESYAFYVWGPHGEGHSVLRLVTSWATQPSNVEAFIVALGKLSAAE